MGSSSAKVSSPSVAGDRWIRRWIVLCAAAATLLFASQIAEIPVRSALRGYDNTFNYLWLRSAMVDGDWDFRNDLVQCNTLTPGYRAAALSLTPTPTGRIPNKYGIGWAVLSLPFYLAADLIVTIGRAIGLWSLARDGFNPVYQICLQFGHGLLAIVALWLATRVVVALVHVEKEIAFAGVILVWAASPLLYYQTANLSMSHGAAFFAVTLMAWALVAVQGRPQSSWPWLLAGAAWGLATITRFQLAVFGIVIAFAAVRACRLPERICGRAREESATGGKSSREEFATSQKPDSPAQRFCKISCAVLVGAAPLLFLQVGAWRVVYGRWLVFSYGAEGEGFHWGRPEIVSSLVSPWHGLFYWHPRLLVATGAFVFWSWRRGAESIGWILAVALTIFVNAAWWCWWFASAFGNRSFDAAILPLMVGFTWALVAASRRWRPILVAVAIAAGAWNFYVVLLYRSGAIPRNEPVTWSEMIVAARALPTALHF
jgi:hypothetical protein